MFQVRCPSCRRLLDVPQGSERATAICPACQATFALKGGAPQTGITTPPPNSAEPSELGIQTDLSQPRTPSRKRSTSIKRPTSRGVDFKIAAGGFCFGVVLGIVIAATFGELSTKAHFVIAFGGVAAALAVFYARVARGFRGDRREIYFWFFLVGSGLFVILLPLTPQIESITTIGDILVAFCATPFAGASFGCALWFLATIVCLLCPAPLRQQWLDTLMAEQPEKAGTQHNSQNDARTDSPNLLMKIDQTNESSRGIKR